MRTARWLQIISWYYLIFLMLWFGTTIRYLASSFPKLPSLSSNLINYGPLVWQEWSSLGVSITSQIISSIGHILLLQGIASTIQFLLKYFQRITPTTD
jgi:hypothetical protein